MGGVLRKYFKYQNFPTYVRLSLFLECFWRNLTKIGQIHIPYKFAQRGCIPSKIKCEILAHKASQTTHATRRGLRRWDVTTASDHHSDHIKGPLVAAFRSPLMNCNFFGYIH